MSTVSESSRLAAIKCKDYKLACLGVLAASSTMNRVSITATSVVRAAKIDVVPARNPYNTSDTAVRSRCRCCIIIDVEI